MTSPRKCIAIKAGVSLALLFLATVASAASIGTVTELDGNLLVSRPNGSVKVLGVGSAIEEGDILTSRKQTYVTLTLADDSTVTLGPDTNLKIERYAFYKHTPDHDGAVLALANGRVRITAGLLGTRAEDTFKLVTPTASLDVKGASVVVEYVAPDQAPLTGRNTAPRDLREGAMIAVGYTPGAEPGLVRTSSSSNVLRLALTAPIPGAKAPGLYVQVLDGLVFMSNPGGSQTFSAGQFGYTASFVQPPVVLPANPGMQFTPPPAFSQAASGTQAGAKAAQVDCEVR